MANVIVSIEIPEADAPRVKAALMRFTSLPSTATPKELLRATLRRLVVSQEAQVEAEAAANKTFVEPGVT